MKLVTWNCRMSFDKKFKMLHDEYDADIYVIQECATPEILGYKNPDIFKEVPNVLWTGDNEHKGLCVLSKMNLEELEWDKYGLRHFIPCKVDDRLDLLALWEPHIEEFYVYRKLNEYRFSDKQIIAGDFNANARSDLKHGVRCFSNVVKDLELYDILSAYHEYTGVSLGNEQPTYFSNRTRRMNDYCFLPKGAVKSVDIGMKFRDLSDHLPVCVEFDEEKCYES